MTERYAAAIEPAEAAEMLDRANIEGRIPPRDRYFVRYRRDGTQVIPFALLRRRVTPEGNVDEVLRDADSWAPDRNGSVDRAVTFFLDTDLDEVSHARVTEFMRMVAERSYRPFTTP